MRPLSNVRVLICAFVPFFVPFFVLACDNGDIKLPPGGPGSGGSGAGGSGGVPGQGTAGNATSGLGGNVSTGLGGNLPSGGGGVSSGVAGSPSSGVGGGVTSGVGGGVTSGVGGKVSSGNAGTGGTAGGVTGSGGGDVCGPSGQVTKCPADFVCGNGTRNICALRWDQGSGFCTSSSTQEACDGADLGGETCQSVAGYPTGTLGCSSKCDFDTSGCSECTEDPAVVRCGVDPTTMLPSVVALASNDSQVAIAWVSTTDGAGKLRFTLLTRDLAPINAVMVSELAASSPLSFPLDAPYFAVAPLPSGWVVAGTGGKTGLFVHTFNAGGANAGRREVAVARETDPYAGIDVRLVPRPGGSPLLLWATGLTYGNGEHHLYAAVLSADGLSTTTPVEVPVSKGTPLALGRGTYVNGQFYAPFTVTTASNASQLEIARISPDGTLADVIDALPGVFVDSPILASAGDQLAVSYLDVGGPPDLPRPDSPVSQRLTLAGAAASSPLQLGSVRDRLGPLLPVGDGFAQVVTYSGVIVGSATVYGDAIEIGPVPAAAPLGTMHPLLAARSLIGTLVDAVSVGTDVVVAWTSRNHLLLTQARP